MVKKVELEIGLSVVGLFRERKNRGERRIVPPTPVIEAAIEAATFMAEIFGRSVYLM